MKLKLLLSIFMVSLLVGCVEKKVEKKQPNIIFLFADDQCYNTVHALGNEEVITPNLDKMVENGATFTHAFNMGSWTGAVCASSRAMLNTGRFVWRAYGFEDKQNELVEKGQMWSQIMQTAGYDTYMTGKWHVQTAPSKIFNHTVHIRGGMPKDNWNHAKQAKLFAEMERTKQGKPEDIMPFGYNRPQSVSDTSWTPWDKNNGGYWQGGKHWSEVLKDDAITFIDSAKGKDKPFFMYLAFNAPHDPRQSPKEFLDMYPLENISVPESFLPLYPYKDSIGCGPALRDAALAPFPRTEYSMKKHRQEYYALITHLDYQIGKIIKALEESGEMDNTYIFYTADHGLAIGENGLVGKQNMYDHSMRPPLFVIGPDIEKGKKIDAEVYLQDIMASSIELAGLPKPEYIEFNSLMSLARGEQTKSNYSAIYGCYKPDLQRMIRTEGFKLIVYPHGKVLRLYDLNKDPKEMHDLASNPEYKEKIKDLFTKLVALQKDMDDPLDLTKIFTSL
ncbi:sulfatase-like hydrolase/transferase [Labilibaculum antarcticum]|nr:sulfatase-like hydrolase/transferase [Labilibaculum antarcticum]